jgi:hypothetical protein
MLFKVLAVYVLYEILFSFSFLILLCLGKISKKSQKFIHIRFFIFNPRVFTVFSNVYGTKNDFLYNILIG